MNEIEKKFYDAYLEYEEIPVEEADNYYLKPSVQIGIYVVDFVFDNDFVIEIDGHEYHKTKEQRFNDYQRERYLMKKGYTVIRFMATEVFIDPIKCVQDMLEIDCFFSDRRCEDFGRGLKAGREGK